MSNALDALALSLVDIYQQHLSPHKGFCCAYRRLHDEPSCSTYFRQQIQVVGVWQAWPRLRSRFKACKQAHLTLSAQIEETEDSSSTGEQQKRRRRERHWHDDCCSNWDTSSCYSSQDCDCSPPRNCDRDLDGEWDCCEADGCNLDNCDGGDWSGCCDGVDSGCCDGFSNGRFIPSPRLSKK